MKTILKNSEVLALYQTLKNLPPHLTGISFLYAASRTVQKLKEVAEPLIAAQNAVINFRMLDKAFEKYEDERISLAKEFANLDETGQAKTKFRELNGVSREVFDVPDEKEKELEKAVASLSKKHKKVFDAEKKSQDDFLKLMEEKSEVELYTIPLEEVPDSIQAGLFNQIYPIIEEKI